MFGFFQSSKNRRSFLSDRGQNLEAKREAKNGVSKYFFIFFRGSEVEAMDAVEAMDEGVLVEMFRIMR